MFRYRDHRGMLEDSLATEQRFESKAKLIQYLQKKIDKYCVTLDCNNIKIEAFGYDKRCGWDNYIVSLDGWGVFGFIDGDITTIKCR